MRSDIQTGQLELEQTEADCSIHNPPVIREYLCATDEDKVLFEMTFKAYKSNTQLKAKERWYDWKMGLIERVGPDVGEVLEGMREVSCFALCTSLAFGRKGKEGLREGRYSNEPHEGMLMCDSYRTRLDWTKCKNRLRGSCLISERNLPRCKRNSSRKGRPLGRLKRVMRMSWQS